MKILLYFGVNINFSHIIIKTSVNNSVLLIVGVEGIGPSTSVLSGQRSTTELHAQLLQILTDNFAKCNFCIKKAATRECVAMTKNDWRKKEEDGR
jgi:hypothetical protein